MTTRHALRVAGLAAAITALASCAEDEATAPPRGALHAEHALAAAVVTDEATAAILVQQLPAFAVMGGVAGGAAGGTRSFSRGRSCPAGGSIAVEGTAERTREDGVLEITFLANGVWDDCAIVRRGGVTVTIDGEFTVESLHTRVLGQPAAGGHTTTKSGHFSWSRSDGESGECEFSVTSVRDPAERTLTVTGNVCGREVNRSIGWNGHG